MKSILLVPALSLALSACVPSKADNPVTDTPVTVANSAPMLPLAWEAGHPERQPWSAQLRNSLRAELARFGTPADIDAYCPRYANLDAQNQVEVLATLVVAIAKRESNYKPETVFAEPPPLGVDSIGLFQMSYEDNLGWCSMDKSQDSLKEPLNNIRCAVGEMARLVARDGVIASGSSVKSGKGLARYWSVMQDGPRHFKAEIQGKTNALGMCAG